jgi:hypothetical protein
MNAEQLSLFDVVEPDDPSRFRRRCVLTVTPQGIESQWPDFSIAGARFTSWATVMATVFCDVNLRGGVEVVIRARA